MLADTISHGFSPAKMTEKKDSVDTRKTLKEKVKRVFLDLVDKLSWSIWYLFPFWEITSTFSDQIFAIADRMWLTYFHLDIGIYPAAIILDTFSMVFILMIVLYNTASRGLLNRLPNYTRFHLFHSVLLSGIFQLLGEMYIGVLRLELPDELVERIAGGYVPLVMFLYVTTMAQTFGAILRSNREKKILPQTLAKGAAVMQVRSSNLDRP